MSSSAPRANATSRGLSHFLPSQQFVRYALVGIWNTVFGYSCFFLLNHWLATIVKAYSYIAANILANLIAISVAFLGYKWFVFRTRGNYLREWLRTLMVYSGSLIVSTLMLAPIVGLIRHTTRYQAQAPYIAGAIVVLFTVFTSFFGHRHFSFRKAPATAAKLERS